MFLLCHCHASEVRGKGTSVVRANVKKTCVPKAVVPTCCAEPAPRLRDSPEQETPVESGWFYSAILALTNASVYLVVGYNLQEKQTLWGRCCLSPDTHWYLGTCSPWSRTDCCMYQSGWSRGIGSRKCYRLMFPSMPVGGD